MNSLATIIDFEKLDFRVGRIMAVDEFPEARKPAYKIVIDFGSVLGEKKSSAQLVDNYSINDLVGKQVICVVNFPPRQIGTFLSEVLLVGLPDENGNCILAGPDQEVPIGGRLY